MVRSEKAYTAVECLAQRVWMEGATTTERTALHNVRACREALSCAACIAWRLNYSINTLETLASTGNAGECLQVDMLVGRGVAGTCAHSGEIIVIDDLFDHNELRKYGLNDVQHPKVVTEWEWHSAIFAPMDIGGQVAGVLAAYAIRPRAFSEQDKKIILAFAQRLSAGYIHAERIEELTEMERRIAIEAPAIEAGMYAIQNVHDATNELSFAQNDLSSITSRFRRDKKNPIYVYARSVSSHVDKAHKIIREITRRAKIQKPIIDDNDLKEIIDEVVDKVQIKAESIRVRIDVHCPKKRDVSFSKRIKVTLFGFRQTLQ
jgi:putative methionine-R-sulfoxide reductase with GAF domain